MRRPSRRQARPVVEELEARVVMSLSPVAAGSPAPFTAIVKLDITYPDGEEFVGTGAMVDSFHVLTAGHVVYSSDHGGWATSITAVPEQHGASEPFGSAESTYVRTFPTWITYDQNHPGLTSPEAMDVGLITLDKPIGYQTGWFTYGYNNSAGAFVAGTVFDTAGYPAAHGYDGLGMQYDSGRIDGLSAGGGGIMFHDPSVTIYGGQSGSPVWSPVNGVVYGVAVSDSFAIRITQGIANQLDAWIASDVPRAPVRVTYAPPTINGGAYGVGPGGSVTISQAQLLAGSLDPQGLPLWAYNVTNPTRGTLTMNSWDWSFTYTPYPGIYGSDSFTIQATDGRQVSNLATITIYAVPPAVSLPSNSMLLVAFGSGDFYQYNTAPELFTLGVRSMSAARAPNGDMYYMVVFSTGQLYRFDKSGAVPLYSGVKSACIAIDPAGSPVYEIVFDNGDLYQVDSTGVLRICGGVNSATITYSATGAPLYEIVFDNNELYQFDAAGVHLISGGVQSAAATFLSSGRLAYQIVYQGGWLVQYDDLGTRFVYGGVSAATLVNMYVPTPPAASKPRTAPRTSAPAADATVATSYGALVADESQGKGKAVVATPGRWARSSSPAGRPGRVFDPPRRAAYVTAGSSRIKVWEGSTIKS